MQSRPAANPRYLKSGQLASFFLVVWFLLLPVVSCGAGFRGFRMDSLFCVVIVPLPVLSYVLNRCTIVRENPQRVKDKD
jgi:hypothetical protein